MAIPDDVLNALMKDYKNPEDLIGETGLIKQLTKQLLERAMQAEMTDHLGYKKNAPTSKKNNNFRNGSYQKRVKGEFGNLDIEVKRQKLNGIKVLNQEWGSEPIKPHDLVFDVPYEEIDRLREGI